jgi:cytochrome P450
MCLKDDTFKTFDIPAGTIIVLFYYGLHRDAKHWTDPEEFRPERFLRKNFDKEKSKAYFPFGSGPRLCIGNNFAMAEMAIFLQRFLPRFKVSPTGQKPIIVPLVTLKPDKILLDLETIG